jgi:hypothetical protein
MLECVQEGGVQVVSVAAASVSSWRRRRWRWPAIPARNRGAGELGLREGYGFEHRERERGKRVPRSTTTFTVADGLLRLGCSATAREAGFHGGEVLR